MCSWRSSKNQNVLCSCNKWLLDFKTFSGFSVGSCINEEEGYLLPTWARKQLANTSTECSSLHSSTARSTSTGMEDWKFLVAGPPWWGGRATWQGTRGQYWRSSGGWKLKWFYQQTRRIWDCDDEEMRLGQEDGDVEDRHLMGSWGETLEPRKTGWGAGIYTSNPILQSTCREM